jgi:hypothetical protein
MEKFWVPEFKWQLVDWFVMNNIFTKSQAEGKSKKQLYAIYYKIRRS